MKEINPVFYDKDNEPRHQQELSDKPSQPFSFGIFTTYLEVKIPMLYRVIGDDDLG